MSIEDGRLFVGLVVLDPTERVLEWFNGEDLVEHESCDTSEEKRPALVTVVRAASEADAQAIIRRRVAKEFQPSDLVQVALRDISDDEGAVSDEGVVKWPLKAGEADLPAVYVAVSEEPESVDDMLEWAHEFVTGR